jgi:transposase
VGTANAVVGIDVSKAALDACLLAPDGTVRGKAFPNTPAGFAALAAWADRHAPGAATHFGMEATGGYEDALACHLHAAGRVVSVINPTRSSTPG